jgi:hypothetical protein
MHLCPSVSLPLCPGDTMLVQEAVARDCERLRLSTEDPRLSTVYAHYEMLIAGVMLQKQHDKVCHTKGVCVWVWVWV